MKNPPRSKTAAMQRGAAFSFALFAATFPLHAARTPKVPAPRPAETVLTGPRITKLDWNTRCLSAADINNDGLTDLLLINNDRASIEFLLQRKPGDAPEPKVPGLEPSRWEPVLDDALFKRVSLTAGTALYDLATGDFDHDGKTDIVYTGERDRLTIRLQRGDRWDTKVIPFAPDPLQYPSGLAVADLNQDGRDDIILLGQKELAVFLQEKSAEFTLSDRLPLTEDNPYGLEIADVDGDGRPDILYLTGASLNPLRIRRQNQDGRYGPEESFDFKGPVSPLQAVRYAKQAKTAPAAFVTVMGTTGQLEFVHFATDATPAADQLSELNPLIFAPRVNARNPALPLLGDFSGNGQSDLVLIDPDGAQLLVYQRNARGDFTVPKTWGTLAEVRSAGIVTWSPKKRPSLVLASAKEGVFAEQSADRNGHFGTPHALAIPGRPLAVAGAYLKGSDTPFLATLTEQDNKRFLSTWIRDAKGDLQQKWQSQLSDLRTDPKDIYLHDIDQDGRTDILVFVPRDGVRIWTQTEAGEFSPATERPAYRSGLLSKADASAVSFADVDHDGKPELIVTSTNFARALRMEPDGELATVAQFNASDSSAEIDTAFVVPDARGKTARVLLHDRKSDTFEVLATDEAGAYTPVRSLKTDRIDVLNSALVAGPGKRQEFFLFARDRFWWIPAGRPNLEMKSDASVGSELPNVRYNYALGDDLEGDGASDILAIDTNNNLVELLQRDAQNKWAGAMHFKVFENDTRQSNRRESQVKEPREAITADVTGDGRPDLILLVHDRVLVYPQK